MSDWYYFGNNEQKGPIAEDELRGRFSAAQLPADTLVWQEGLKDWTKAASLPAFSAAIPVAAKISPALPSIVPLKLVQKNFLRGEQTFELVSAAVFRFTTGKGKKRVERQVNPLEINPVPQRVRKWAIPALILAGIMVLILAVFLLGCLAALILGKELGEVGAMLFTTFFLLTFTVFLVGNAFQKRQNSLVFSTTSGSSLALWFENPDKKSFDDFVSQFQSALAQIEKTRPPEPAPVVVPEQPKVCANCQSPQLVPDVPTPLCAPCRTALINFPVPRWLRFAAGALVLLLLISAVRIPWEISAYLVYEKGQIAEQKNDYQAAEKNYQQVLLSYPRSLDVLTSLARAAHRAGDQATAMDCVNRIIEQVGPKGIVSKEVIGVINEVRGNS